MESADSGLKVWAYCAADWEKATWHAAGIPPLVSPPQDSESIESHLATATRADVVYLNLHGFIDQPYLYGQKNKVIGPTSLTVDQVVQHDWSGVIVFAEVCFSAKDGGSSIARAFLGRGAEAVIGSVDEAFGRARPTILDGEADRLFWLFRLFYERIRDGRKALRRAKSLLRLMSWPLDDDDRATLKSFVYLGSGRGEKDGIKSKT